MSVLDVWNQALSAAHARGRLSALDDVSPEQEVCAEWYGLVLGSVQSAAWWPSCKAVVRLAQISEAGDEWTSGQPEPGYAYSYGLPAGLLHPWHLSDYSSFSLSYDTTHSRQIISTNTEDAILVYARKNEDPAQWGDPQTRATVFALASHIAGPLTGQRSLIERNYQLAQGIIEAEQMRVANITEPDPRPSVPWLAARGYRSYSTARYYYPFGSFLSPSPS